MMRKYKVILKINGRKSLGLGYYEIINRMKIELFALIIILNVILRFQVVAQEIGWDSFDIHIMINSLNEFGYAKWFLSPLSIFGLYPASYTSAMQFLFSGISQYTGMEMRWVIFLYCISIGILSIFTAYIMAGEIIDNDLFKFLVSFGFSTSPEVLGYSTWTIPTRGLLVVLTPLLIYLLLKCRTSIKYVPLVILLTVFLFATHHLFYFLLPVFISFLTLTICFKIGKYLRFKIPNIPTPFVPIGGFFLMYSIPFFTRHFIESSIYAPIYLNYIRYSGILIIPAIGGLFYLIFKRDKSYNECFLLLTVIFLTAFIYLQTYMKWFFPIFLAPFAGIGLINILITIMKKKYLLLVIIFFMLIIGFSAYYQFIHFLPKLGENPTNERYIEESTYKTGRWMKEYVANGSAISNDLLFGSRIFSASETVHVLTGSTINDFIYGFISVNISQFKRYPITSEDFWFFAYEGPDIGEIAWESIHITWKSPEEFNISYVVENKKCGSRICWHHSGNYPQFLHQVYNKNCIYDSGNINIWSLD